jgi:hypothetical protein
MQPAGPPAPLDYANAHSLAWRRRSRAAVASAAIVALAAIVNFTLLRLAHTNRLPSHFLCCKYPALTFTLFVLLPGAGAAMAILAVARIARRREILKGLPIAIPALLLNLLLAACGFVLFYALKA